MSDLIKRSFFLITEWVRAKCFFFFFFFLFFFFHSVPPASPLESVGFSALEPFADLTFDNLCPGAVPFFLS